MATIAVFGSSLPKDGDADYESAYRFGVLLGQAGHTVLTGGYAGTMEAVSRGVVEGGGKTIGVTCEQIEAFRPLGPNPWVQKEWRTRTLLERLDKLVTNANAAVALPGGPGTITEIVFTWNLLVIRALPRIPLLLVGQGWRDTFDALFKTQDRYISAEARELITFVPNVITAAAELARLLGVGQQADV